MTSIAMPTTMPTTMPATGLDAMTTLGGMNGAASAAAKLKAAYGGARSAANQAKAKAASQDFEAVFLNSMFQQMFTGLQGEGPFGGNGATGVWRSFLTDEYSKSFAKAGGVGIADQVYKSLLAHQEARS